MSEPPDIAQKHAVLHLAHIRQTLDTLRIDAGMSATDLADAIDRDKSTVRRWNEGKPGMTASDLVLYARVLGYRVVLVKDMTYQPKIQRD